MKYPLNDYTVPGFFSSICVTDRVFPVYCAVIVSHDLLKVLILQGLNQLE